MQKFIVFLSNHTEVSLAIIAIHFTLFLISSILISKYRNFKRNYDDRLMFSYELFPIDYTPEQSVKTYILASLIIPTYSIFIILNILFTDKTSNNKQDIENKELERLESKNLDLQRIYQDKCSEITQLKERLKEQNGQNRK